jgi:metallo-beta-lactamase family protein
MGSWRRCHRCDAKTEAVKKGGRSLKITFLGAAKTVTGSCFWLEDADLSAIVDCGLFQGGSETDELNREEWAFDPTKLDAVLLTHAHIDHSGLIPRLVKEGFRGKIYATPATIQLCQVMLRDSAHIQEMEAEWTNRKGTRAGTETVEPLYTQEDAENALALFAEAEYDQPFSLNDSVQVVFRNAGHILGSAIIDISFPVDGKTETIVFTGDLGREDQPIICDPHSVEAAEYLVIESTYGNRYHSNGPEERRKMLLEVLKEAIARKGKIIIPAFAVARTQDLLYELNNLVEQKMIPQIPVYIDSPLAITATEIFAGNPEYYDQKTKTLIAGGDHPFEFPGLSFARTVDESKALNTSNEPAIIISASGMCEAGRIKHHLKHNLWKPETTVLFIGYQAKNTLGRRIKDGEKRVKIFGEDINIKAQIRSIEGFSSHADKNDLINWVEALSKTLKKIFVVHGEEEASLELAQALKEKFDVDTIVPERGHVCQITPDEVKIEAPAKEAPAEEVKVKPVFAADEATAFYNLVRSFEENVLKADKPDRKKVVEMQIEIMKKMLDLVKEEALQDHK